MKKQLIALLMLFAASATHAGLPDVLPDIVNKTVGNGGRLYDSFVVDKKLGITGWVFSNNKIEHGVFYTMGDYAFYGQLLKGGETNIAALDASRYHPQSDVGALVGAFNKSGVILDPSHKGGKRIYMIMDPSCLHCRDFLIEYDRAKKAGKLKGVSFAFVPVDLLGGMSRALAHDILSSKKPYQRMFKLMTDENSQYRPVGASSPARKLLEHNSSLLVSKGMFNSTPSFLIPKPNGGYWPHNGALDMDLLLAFAR